MEDITELLRLVGIDPTVAREIPWIRRQKDNDSLTIDSLTNEDLTDSLMRGHDQHGRPFLAIRLTGPKPMVIHRRYLDSELWVGHGPLQGNSRWVPVETIHSWIVDALLRGRTTKPPRRWTAVGLLGVVGVLAAFGIFGTPGVASRIRSMLR